jgi:hypothetical protein
MSAAGAVVVPEWQTEVQRSGWCDDVELGAADGITSSSLEIDV